MQIYYNVAIQNKKEGILGMKSTKKMFMDVQP